MIKLLLAPAGTGKSYWLEQQAATVRVGCTNKSHRSILAAIADALGYTYPSRASIDDLLQIILAAPSTTIALDDIDRTAQKFCYSLITLSTRHTILATATEKRRIKVLLERQAAILVPLPAVNIADVVASHYPDLPPHQVKRIATMTDNPAAAINIAQSIKSGQPLPQPPTQSLFPLVIILSLAALAFIRYYSHYSFSPVAIALIYGIAFYIRRILWKKA